MFRRSLNSVTLFNSRNSLNNNLLNKLRYFNYKYKLDIKDQPTYADYKHIHEHCLNIHPDNITNLLKSYPQLKENKSRLFLSDLNLIKDDQFGRLRFHGPLIVDWTNGLIANDEKSLSRIFSNYAISDNDHKFKHIEPQEQAAGAVNGFNIMAAYPLVHPHVAEFADLF